MKVFVKYLIALALLAIVGCSDSIQNPVSPIASTDPKAALSAVQPMCQLGCLDPDPNPAAPGYYLGSGVTPTLCYYGDYTDADGDGLGDLCEAKLAAAFAPELYYFDGDNVKREPRWAARIMDNDVLLAYLLSYYRDEGSTSTYYCEIPFASPHCNGHNGDSEYIMLRVYYTESTQHWVLGVAQYSQHEGWATYLGGQNPYPAVLTYPDHLGGYPRSYVAQGKHANYATISECNAGGAYGTDYCGDVNAFARVDAGSWLNIGSRSAPLIDCVTSTNPLHPEYGNNKEECYWTNQPFLGWYANPAGDSPTAYTIHLADFGF